MRHYLDGLIQLENQAPGHRWKKNGHRPHRSITRAQDLWSRRCSGVQPGPSARMVQPSFTMRAAFPDRGVLKPDINNAGKK